MSIANERALRKAMRERSFERVYYFQGEDDFLKESTAREVMTAVLDASTRDFNLELLRGDEVSAERLTRSWRRHPCSRTGAWWWCATSRR